MFKTTSTLNLILLFALLIGFAACNEDTIAPTGEGSISGVVLNAETSQPMIGAAITTNPASTAVVTDDEGRFRLVGVSGGNYMVTAKKAGYKNETVSVAVKNDVQTDVVIMMTAENGTSTGAPGLPSNPDPAENAQNQGISDTLRWQRPAFVKGQDSVFTYDVYLYESGSTHKQLIKENVTDTMVAVTNLKYNTTYFWQVLVENSSGKVTNGPVWSFATQQMPLARYVFASEVNGNWDIYSSDGTQNTRFRLTDSFSREWWPVISPNRDKIAYSSNIGMEPHIYTMNRDGSEKRQLTTIPLVGYHNQGIGFTWSPDGGQVLYANYDNLYRIDRNGTGLRLIAKAPAGRHFRMLDWTASGDKIVAQTIGSDINDSEIYILNADGSNMTLLVGNLPGRVESPSLSINGQKLLYTKDVDGFENAEGRQLNARIFVRNIATGEEVDMSRNKPAGTNDLFPRYSPDGAKIIFVNAPNDNQGPNTIWVMDATDGSNRKQLFTNGTMPDWK
ncbi:carboxypeptidase-like regulatory domain-containing protein [Pontibacter sp. Tf4]|uniref:carboxypeptidase-like regulatory domain-containing protein n=1 Tax=Pontibacter sp. Tf4 TaxID=2761620 RepID=UPI00162822EA|nr:carboxypeptidase-like regulatory domain-containing protein [Pontibacter sp. Tf4]MBB6612487.1 carboxypeptidase-like regulatory domain-containing protein [Pontibacter sp. Tf4]